MITYIVFRKNKLSAVKNLYKNIVKDKFTDKYETVQDSPVLCTDANGDEWYFIGSSRVTESNKTGLLNALKNNADLYDEYPSFLTVVENIV